MEKQWVLPEPLTPEDKQQVESLAGELKCPEIIAELLYRKNLKTVDQVTDFFHPQLSQQHDPFLFPDMEKAVVMREFPDGRSARTDLRARAIAYLGHLPALKADLDTLQNLDFLCGLHGRRARQLPGDALGMVGLAGHEDTLARQLSAGQKKRLSLARLWLSPAPLWLLDEPYANLDLDGINLVNRMISAHLRDGGAALVTTHGAYAAPPVQTRMLVLKAGRND